MDYARLSNNTDGLIGPDLYGFCLYLFLMIFCSYITTNLHWENQTRPIIVITSAL